MGICCQLISFSYMNLYTLKRLNINKQAAVREDIRIFAITDGLFAEELMLFMCLLWRRSHVLSFVVPANKRGLVYSVLKIKSDHSLTVSYN